MANVNVPQKKASGYLGYQLKITQHFLRQRMDTALDSTGLTAPQYAVLCAVDADPGVSNADLARMAFVTPQTMQGMLAGLARLGYVSREPHPEHGRIIQTSLTAQGRKALLQAHSIAASIEAQMLSGLSASERTALGALLSRCADNLADTR